MRVAWNCIVAFAALSACEPNVLLGIDEQPEGPGAGTGGASFGGGSGAEPAEPRLIAGASGAGAPGTGDGLVITQGHSCSLVHPGEAHPEPVAVCCFMNDEESQWREQAFVHINQTRQQADLAPFERDAALDQAAMAWAMHWSLHWSPTEKTGYPGRSYSPSEVASSCGTTAELLMATDAQEEPVDANGLVDSAFPADYWSTDDNLKERFMDGRYVRLGVGLYDGLLVGILGD